MKLIMFFSMAMFLSSLLMMVGHFLPKRNLEQEKSSPYECGFDPMKSTRLPFSFRFFLMAMLFLMFDLEMALLFPMIPALKYKLMLLLPLSSLFLIMLAAGLAYEWIQGGLEWAE